MDSKQRGSLAENYAEKLLKKKGYRILERNFRTPFSEIDIIAIKRSVLVFVEVKARWGVKFGKPEEAVNSRKLDKIKKSVDLFSLKKGPLPKKFRIEVVSLLFEGEKIVSEKIIKVY